jgi:hypothetical protein
MHPLIDRLAAAGDGRYEAPFFLVAEAAAVAVPRADVRERTERTFVDDRAGFAKRTMIAMIEPDANERTRAQRRGADRIELVRVARGGLFHQDVFARGRRQLRDRCEVIVRGCHDDHGDVIPLDRDARLGGRFGSVPLGECVRAAEIDVARDAHAARRDRCGALLTDEAAADDRDAELAHHDQPRSSGMIRRSV